MRANGHSSYHPVMDVRINLDGNRKVSEEEVYTSRTREYLQEALRRGQTGDGEKPQRQGNARSHLERDFVKEIGSKKAKAKTRTKLASKRDQAAAVGSRKPRTDASRQPRPGARKETQVSAKQPPKRSSTHPRESKESTAKWASSREPLPVTKPVTRRLLAPVAGIRTMKPTKRRERKPLQSADNLVGLERVDEEFQRDAKPRTNSSSAALRTNHTAKLPSKSSNLIGSRSAPTLSTRRPGLGGAPTLAASSELEDSQPAYRVHAPMPARLLNGGPTRRPPLAPNKSAVRLAPLDAPPPATLAPLNPSVASTSTTPSTLENPKTILRRRSSSSVDASSSSSLPPSLARGTKPLVSSASSSSSDDHIAALFAQHAKKLSDNLEKASNLSLRYQHMKHYDGMTASSRHVESGSLLPLQRPSNQSLGEEGEGERRGDGFIAPTKLSMII
jgi:hypothetical protein